MLEKWRTFFRAERSEKRERRRREKDREGVCWREKEKEREEKERREKTISNQLTAKCFCVHRLIYFVLFQRGEERERERWEKGKERREKEREGKRRREERREEKKVLVEEGETEIDCK